MSSNNVIPLNISPMRLKSIYFFPLMYFKYPKECLGHSRCSINICRISAASVPPCSTQISAAEGTSSDASTIWKHFLQNCLSQHACGYLQFPGEMPDCLIWRRYLDLYPNTSLGADSHNALPSLENITYPKPMPTDERQTLDPGRLNIILSSKNLKFWRNT